MFDNLLVCHIVTMHIHILKCFKSEKIPCVKAELRILCVRRRKCGTWSQSSCVETELRNDKSQYIFFAWIGTTEFPSIISCADLKVTQYSMCGSGTAGLEVAVHSYCGGGTAVPRNLDKEYSLCGSRTAEFKVTAYSLCGSGTLELQVTEHSVCGSGNASHRIFYVWNMQWPERQGSAGPQAPGSKPSWWCCYLLVVAPTGICFCFLRYYQAVRNQLTYDRDPGIRQTAWPKAAGTT